VTAASVRLQLIGLDVCDCGAPRCRECGEHTERDEDVQPGWDIGGWRCVCGWCITDVLGPPISGLD